MHLHCRGDLQIKSLLIRLLCKSKPCKMSCYNLLTKSLNFLTFLLPIPVYPLGLDIYMILCKILCVVRTAFNLVKPRRNHNLSTMPSSLQKESNLSEYIWSNSATSIAQPDSRSAKASDPVGMKAKGYSPLVQKICSQFDAALSRMLDDLAFYVNQGRYSVLS